MQHPTCELPVNASESANGDAERDAVRSATPHHGCRLLASVATQERVSRCDAPGAAPERANAPERDSEAVGGGPSSRDGVEPDAQAERKSSKGSREQWPRCGAMTRAGTPCRAAGAGLGGRRGHARCPLHGGLSLGPGRDTQLVFFGTGSWAGLLFDGSGFARQRRARWKVNAMPLWIAQQLPAEALAEPDYCQHLLRTLALKHRNGKMAPRRRLHRVWPQELGFRVALTLLERGRVAYGVFSYGEDAARWVRRHGCCGEVRMSPTELLAAMRAVGGPIAKRQRTQRVAPDAAPSDAPEVQP
jgi:hypothetical protein